MSVFCHCFTCLVRVSEVDRYPRRTPSLIESFCFSTLNPFCRGRRFFSPSLASSFVGCAWIFEAVFYTLYFLLVDNLSLLVGVWDEFLPPIICLEDIFKPPANL